MPGDHRGKRTVGIVTDAGPTFLVDLRRLRRRLTRSTTADPAILQLAEAETPVRIVPGSELNGTQNLSVEVVPADSSAPRAMRILRELLLTPEEHKAQGATPRRTASELASAIAESSGLED